MNKKIRLLLYLSHALSAWGDRMWQFAVGMFLVEISPGSLRLTASYGFASGGAILLLGAIIGNWVDKYPRLKVARSSIIFQNLCVCLSAIVVCLIINCPNAIRTVWGGWLETLCLVGVVLFAVLADIGSVARQICVERDWIVAMCENETVLTALSATLRRIDLTTNVLAPIVTGQIITYGSTTIGAIFITGWNIVSLFVEYGLLYKIYKSVPELRKPKGTKGDELATSQAVNGKPNDITTDTTPNNESNDIALSEDGLLKSIDDNTDITVEDEATKEAHMSSKSSLSSSVPAAIVRSSRRCPTCIHSVLSPFRTIIRGWKIYMSAEIVFAGISLSSLYLTVLGFDNVTSGYAKQQGLTESIVGILLAAGAGVGIIGTFIFPFARNKLGLAKTGVIALAMEILCLIVCLISVFAPGSPFYEVNAIYTEFQDDINQVSVNSTLTPYNVSGVWLNTTSIPESTASLTSVIMLMTGIVSSRAGLWMADLTITQLLLEKPKDTERGIINGVQNSLNKLVDILKFVLVIMFPLPKTFGYLVFVSFCFVVFAAVLFSVYGSKHWQKEIPADTQENIKVETVAEPNVTVELQESNSQNDTNDIRINQNADEGDEESTPI